MSFNNASIIKYWICKCSLQHFHAFLQRPWQWKSTWHLGLDTRRTNALPARQCRLIVQPYVNTIVLYLVFTASLVQPNNKVNPFCCKTSHAAKKTTSATRNHCKGRYNALRSSAFFLLIRLLLFIQTPSSAAYYIPTTAYLWPKPSI